MGTKCQSRNLVILFVAVIGASSSLAQSKRVPSDSDINLVGKRTLGGVVSAYPISHESELGEALSREITRDLRIIDDPEATMYLNRLAQHLAENSDIKTPFRLYIINSVHPNAILLSGGYLFMSSMLILQTNNEAELAGILAHCLTHAALPTGTEKLAQKAMIMIPGMVILPIEEPLGGPIPYLGEEPPPPSLLKKLRDAELDADYFGLQYVYLSGFDPNSFIDFLNRISRGSTNITLSNDRELPLLLERIKAMRKEIAEILPSRASEEVSSSEYDAVRERLRQIKLPVPSFRKWDDFDPPIIRYSPKPSQTTHIN